jgi:dipeptidyl aminopeptidase/acylaminoacyl peptidase
LTQPLGSRKQLTFALEPARNPSFVPGNDAAVIYTADIGGNEQHQLFRLDLSTGETTRLTDGASRNGGPVLARDGKRMAFSSNRRNGKDFDIWVSNSETAESAELVAEGTGWWGPVGWSRDGTQLLVTEYISINESRIYSVDVATKKLRRITPEGAASYRDAVLSSDGKRAYITTDREGEFVELYEVSLSSDTWRPLSRDIQWNVDSIALSGDGRTLAFSTNEGGASVVHLLDTRTRKHKKASGIPQGVIDGLQFADAANVLGFSLDSPSRGVDAYTYDVRKGRLSRWTESEIGGLDASGFAEPTLIEYESFDGTKIPAHYYRPAGAGPFPVVISIHGGPEAQARPQFSSLVQYMVTEQKLAVLVPNVRGSDGYGKTYLTLDNGALREDSVKDIGALLDWIGKQRELDAARVGVIGGSYGGYMVLASLVHFGDRIVAGIDIVGISSFVTFLENTAEYRRDLRRAEYGDERDPKMREHLEKISPLNSVDRIKSALFVAQGANDPRVPASEAEQIVAAVRKGGHDCWYMLAKNEGHGFAKKESSDTFALLTAMFFAKHLGLE